MKNYEAVNRARFIEAIRAREAGKRAYCEALRWAKLFERPEGEERDEYTVDVYELIIRNL